MILTTPKATPPIDLLQPILWIDPVAVSTALASERLQRIAWLEGHHLLSAIRVGTEARVHPVVQ